MVSAVGHGDCLLPLFLCDMGDEDSKRDSGTRRKHRLSQAVTGRQIKFETLTAFLYMDGHGLYVWAAYGVTALVLAANVWWPLMARRTIIRSARSDMARKMEDRS